MYSDCHIHLRMLTLSDCDSVLIQAIHNAQVHQSRWNCWWHFQQDILRRFWSACPMERFAAKLLWSTHVFAGSYGERLCGHHPKAEATMGFQGSCFLPALMENIYQHGNGNQHVVAWSNHRNRIPRGLRDLRLCCKRFLRPSWHALISSMQMSQLLTPTRCCLKFGKRHLAPYMNIDEDHKGL
jgi:hypothetical protein